jgi:polar amino acid transport system substrate-binding protein
MRSLKLLMAAAVALACATPLAARADKLQDALNNNRLRVGVLLDAAPWGFKDGKGESAGLDIDLAKQMADDLGVKLELVQVTGASRIPSLLSGRIDVLVAALGATPERATQAMFSQPYAAVQLGVYGGENFPAATTVDGLKGRRIGVAQASTLDVWLTDNAKGATIVRFPDTPSAIAAYLAGQVDAFAENSAIAAKVAEDNAAKAPALKYRIRLSPAHLAVAQGEQNLLNWINTFLFTKRLNGQLSEWQQRWFKEVVDLPHM